MDIVLAGSEDQLLSSLQFKLPPSASYIQERRLVSWYPSGASTFSPTGVREARFSITGDSWLDPASLRVNLKLRNNNALPIQLASCAHSLIRRMKLLIKWCSGGGLGSLLEMRSIIPANASDDRLVHE